MLTRLLPGLTTFLIACAVPDASEAVPEALVPAPTGSVRVLARSAAVATYPCARCHNLERPADPRPRALTELHDRIALRHGDATGWCYRCHVPGDPGQFRLHDGPIVGFDQAYVLCGSCHGDIAADWRVGLHGLTTGHWNGDKQRRSCTACHDPHTPRFPKLVPRAAPKRPRTAPSAEVHG